MFFDAGRTNLAIAHALDLELKATIVTSSPAIAAALMAYDNIETLKNLVEIGSGVSLVPEDTVRREAQEGQLAAIPLVRQDVFQRPAGLLVKNSKVRRMAVRAFVEAMRLPV